MTGDPKPSPALLEAIMADLGRQRQEELPLSNEQRCCTYDPNSRGNRHKKVSVQQAKAASSAWANFKIQDEETEQMEGLELPECPWRPDKPPPGMSARHHDFNMSKDTNRNFASGHPRAVRPRRPVLQDNTAGFTVFHEKAKIDLDPELKKEPKPKPEPEPEPELEPQPASGTSITPNVQNNSVHHVQDSTVDNDTTLDNTPLCACVFQNGQLFDGAENPIAYFGCFMNYPGEGGSENRFLVEFKIKVQLSPSNAWIILDAKGRGKRQHDLSLLNSPQMANQFCILTTRRPPSAKYYLELKDLKTTKLFCDCVNNTQKWLAHMRGDATSEAESSAPSTGAAEVSSIEKPNTNGVGTKAHHQEKELMKNPTEEQNSSTNVPGVTPKANQEVEKLPNGVLEQKKAVHASQDAACLINIGESLPPKTPEKKISKSTARICTEEAFDGLWKAAGTLFSTVLSAGEGEKKLIHDEIEEALNAKWAENKIPETYSKVKEDLLANLHSFIDMRFELIKDVIQLANRSSNQDIPESMREFLKPICYEPVDLENLRPRATNCPEDIKKAKFLPEKGAVKGPSPSGKESYFANREGPNTSTLRKLWSTAPSMAQGELSTQTASTAVTSIKPAEQRTAPALGSTSASPSATGNSQQATTPRPRPKPLGLSSSMYANK